MQYLSDIYPFEDCSWTCWGGTFRTFQGEEIPVELNKAKQRDLLFEDNHYLLDWLTLVSITEFPGCNEEMQLVEFILRKATIVELLNLTLMSRFCGDRTASWKVFSHSLCLPQSQDRHTEQVNSKSQENIKHINIGGISKFSWSYCKYHYSGEVWFIIWWQKHIGFCMVFYLLPKYMITEFSLIAWYISKCYFV